MGLMDLVGQVLEQQQTNTGSAPPSGMSQVLGQLLGGSGFGNQGGGIGGLVDQFRSAGLGHVAESWVGTGPNHSVSPQQLRTVFGDEQVQQMADQSGMEPQSFLSRLSQHLPRVVDGMTPNGQIPDEEPDEGPVSV
jgi:uncharacterized protein YidB (DUF937 family)